MAVNNYEKFYAKRREFFSPREMSIIKNDNGDPVCPVCDNPLHMHQGVGENEDGMIYQGMGERYLCIRCGSVYFVNEHTEDHITVKGDVGGFPIGKYDEGYESVFTVKTSEYGRYEKVRR